MTQSVTEKIVNLRNRLCVNDADFCRSCFKDGKYAADQNPPNVFRRRPDDTLPKFFFVFDKPNNNDLQRGKKMEPIEILDPRFNNPTRTNMIKLLEILGMVDSNDSRQDVLCAPMFHITNAVKCDRCALTGETGQIQIDFKQTVRCRKEFFYKELALLKPEVLVMFGKHADLFTTGKKGPIWKERREMLDGNMYTVIRVPHTTATPFNTHGEKGFAYKEKLAHIWDRHR